METNFFKECTNPAELDARHQEILRVLNLDSDNSDNELKVLIEADYKHVLSSFKETKAKLTQYLTLPEILKAIKELNLKGELCGNWLWLSGSETHAHRESLRNLGFRYSPNKRAWYWRRYEYRSNNQNPLPMELIREKFGSTKVENFS